MTRLPSVPALLALVLVLSACSEAAEAGGGAEGGRRPPSTTSLAPSDVAVIATGTIDAGIPITGDLQPIERVAVRARLDGEISDVHVREGQMVRPGQLLARFVARDEVSVERSSQAEVTAARTEVSTAEWELEQTRKLHQEGAVPLRDVRVGEQLLVAARARLAAAQSRLRQNASTVSDTRVLAPMGGVIERRSAAPGEHVSRGSALFSVVRTDVLELTAALPPRAAAQVAPGQVVRFTADGSAFDGRIARVSPTLTPGSRALTVYVQVPNAGGRLKAGSFAAGKVVSETVGTATLVPLTALHESADGSGRFAWRLRDDVLEKAPVTLGIVDEAAGVAQVSAGLAVGDRVVVGNVGALGAGTKVRVLKPSARGDRGRS